MEREGSQPRGPSYIKVWAIWEQVDPAKPAAEWKPKGSLREVPFYLAEVQAQGYDVTTTIKFRGAHSSGSWSDRTPNVPMTEVIPRIIAQVNLDANTMRLDNAQIDHIANMASLLMIAADRYMVVRIKGEVKLAKCVKLFPKPIMIEKDKAEQIEFDPDQDVFSPCYQEEGVKKIADVDAADLERWKTNAKEHFEKTKQRPYSVRQHALPQSNPPPSQQQHLQPQPMSPYIPFGTPGGSSAYIPQGEQDPDKHLPDGTQVMIEAVWGGQPLKPRKAMVIGPGRVKFDDNGEEADYPPAPYLNGRTLTARRRIIGTTEHNQLGAKSDAYVPRTQIAHDDFMTWSLGGYLVDPDIDPRPMTDLRVFCELNWGLQPTDRLSRRRIAFEALMDKTLECAVTPGWETVHGGRIKRRMHELMDEMRIVHQVEVHGFNEEKLRAKIKGPERGDALSKAIADGVGAPPGWGRRNVPGTQPTPGTPTTGSARLNMRCYKCGQLGHSRPQCPQRTGSQGPAQGQGGQGRGQAPTDGDPTPRNLRECKYCKDNGFQFKGHFSTECYRLDPSKKQGFQGRGVPVCK